MAIHGAAVSGLGAEPDQQLAARHRARADRAGATRLGWPNGGAGCGALPGERDRPADDGQALRAARPAADVRDRDPARARRGDRRWRRRQPCDVDHRARPDRDRHVGRLPVGDAAGPPARDGRRPRGAAGKRPRRHLDRGPGDSRARAADRRRARRRLRLALDLPDQRPGRTADVARRARLGPARSAARSRSPPRGAAAPDRPHRDPRVRGIDHRAARVHARAPARALAVARRGADPRRRARRLGAPRHDPVLRRAAARLERAAHAHLRADGPHPARDLHSAVRDHAMDPSGPRTRRRAGRAADPADEPRRRSPVGLRLESQPDPRASGGRRARVARRVAARARRHDDHPGGPDRRRHGDLRDHRRHRDGEQSDRALRAGLAGARRDRRRIAADVRLCGRDPLLDDLQHRLSHPRRRPRPARDRDRAGGRQRGPAGDDGRRPSPANATVRTCSPTPTPRILEAR